jgi:GTP cyclohydrolase I
MSIALNAAQSTPDLRSAEEVLELHSRSLPPEQIEKFEGYIGEIFTALGLDLDTPSTNETPARFMRAMIDITEGYEGDAKVLKAFETECDGGLDCRLSQVIEGPIQFYALCEHHALPVHGSAYVAYIPHERIIGISKLTRLVRVFARRFTVQERLGQQIATAMEAMMQPYGVAIYLEAHHFCVQMRGVRETSPTTRTTSWKGDYLNEATLRSEFFSACHLPVR